MTLDELVDRISGGLIVSCQALDDEPLHGASVMQRMAIAAAMGGAVGIRANGADDIREIKAHVDLPIIGIVKRTYPDSPIYITATLCEVQEVAEAGADVVALDATARPRPGGTSLASLISQVRMHFPDLLIMADISTIAEARDVSSLGVDIVASTMSGYTPYSRRTDEPDYSLIQSLVESLPGPIIAEGRIRTPEQALRCIELGCTSVVVGSAITRPQEITRSFAELLHQRRAGERRSDSNGSVRSRETK